MPRIRTIKPETAEDEKLGSVSRDARLMFILLWTICDDHGRFRAAPVHLRSRLFGYDDDASLKDVAGWLGELATIGRVQLYEVDGERYGAVANWTKHQRIDNASKPLYPDPPVPADTTPTPPQPSANRGESPQGEASDGDSPLDLDLDLDLEVDLEGTRTATSSHPPTLALVPLPLSPAATDVDPVKAVFAAWQDATGKTRAKLDNKRRRRIQLALKDYPLDEVIDAVRGWRQSAFHRGQNERARPYNDLDLLLRDAKHIEEFRDMERGAAHQQPVVAATQPKGWDALQRALERRGTA